MSDAKKWTLDELSLDPEGFRQSLREQPADKPLPVFVGETGAKVIEFVLSWHPLDDGDPVEIPLGEPWLLPGTDVKVGEFRLSTREVPEVSGA